MGLLTLSEIVKPSFHKGWGVGAYDTVDLPMTFGILDAAEADKAPVIIMIYPGMVPTEYYATYAAFIKEEVKRRGITASLILDHGPSIKEVEVALAAGFNGVMIDASTETLEKNIEITKQVVEMAHKVGVPVEAELGHVGLGSDCLPEDEMRALYTCVEDAKRFVAETGVDILAVAIGTAHGLYKFEPKLDFERLEELSKAINVPLVMHGSSGTPNDQVSKAVKMGINKINVFTDMRMAAMKKIQPIAAQPCEAFNITDLDDAIRAETKKVVQEKNALFGAVGKAALYS